MYGFLIVNKPIAKYLALTEIRPISSYHESEYQTFNFFTNKFNKTQGPNYDLNENQRILDSQRIGEISLEFKTITKTYLENLFIEKLKDNIIFENTIKKLGIINKKNYKNEKLYDDAVTRFAASIKLIPPDFLNKTESKKNFWTIEHVIEDKMMWLKFLQGIKQPTNSQIKIYLINSFSKFITNKKELEKFKIEDIETQIENTLKNYEITSSRRVAYLTEQAEIARKLDVAKNRLESQVFTTQIESPVVTTFMPEMPYYMRGYEMIEKEIELIKNRKDKKAFALNLEDLEIQMRSLKSDKVLQRMEYLFNSTPITSDEFYAVKIMDKSTKFKMINKQYRMHMLFYAALLGAIIGTFFVLISNLIKKRG